MTKIEEELSKSLIARGYLVIIADWWEIIAPGEIIEPLLNGKRIGIRVYIICETTREDFEEHRKLCEWETLPDENHEGAIYYRVGVD